MGISIHAPRKGERRHRAIRCSRITEISIHAPRKGERHVRVVVGEGVRGISIHAPRKGERPCVSTICSPQSSQFQSTLPARGSDPCGCRCPASRQNFNPRSRKGERRRYDIAPELDATISIHAPRKGERRHPTAGLSTSYKISIHAPRKGERRAKNGISASKNGISIHAPRKGERLFSRRKNK